MKSFVVFCLVLGISVYLVSAEPAKEEAKEEVKAEPAKEEVKEAEPAKDGEFKPRFMVTVDLTIHVLLARSSH